MTVDFGKLLMAVAFSVFVAVNATAERLSLENGGAVCVIETKGARLMSFVPRNGEEVVWQSEPEQLEDAQWAHGGIPVCWPWFGRAGEDDDHIHGFAWKRIFKVVSIENGADASRLTLKLTTAAAELIYRATLRASELTLELETVNLTDDPLVFGAAFHPYFRVAERDECWLDGVPGRKKFALNQTVDDVIHFASPVAEVQYRLQDVRGGRTLQITAFNSSGVNIWNPGAAKDCPGTINGDDWRRFVAVEPMARGEGRLNVLEKGGRHRFGMRIVRRAADDRMRVGRRW